jgi:hypothetical protein
MEGRQVHVVDGSGKVVAQVVLPRSCQLRVLNSTGSVELEWPHADYLASLNTVKTATTANRDFCEAYEARIESKVWTPIAGILGKLRIRQGEKRYAFFTTLDPRFPDFSHSHPKIFIDLIADFMNSHAWAELDSPIPDKERKPRLLQSLKQYVAQGVGQAQAASANAAPTAETFTDDQYK